MRINNNFYLRKTVTLICLTLLQACNLLGGEPPDGTPTAQTNQATALPSPNTVAPATVPVQPPTQPAIPSPSTPTALPPTPILSPAAPATGLGLAFLKEGDIWYTDGPGAASQQLTQNAGLISFAWAPDGNRLATHNGRTICFVTVEGGQPFGCYDLGYNDLQSRIERRLVWSPDQRYLVVWNPVNPWDEGAIGWQIIALDGANLTWRIEDPVDWGASLSPNNEPGGITGQPVFLPDGRLIGTLTHRWLCGSGGCHYQLYQFDFSTGGFSAFPNKPGEGWSEGPYLTLSGDGTILANYGFFVVGENSYVTFADLFNLGDQSRHTFSLDQESLASLALSPSATQAVIARLSTGAPDQPAWSQNCGLLQGMEVLPMQVWDFSGSVRNDIFAGLSPAWSPNGAWLAFQSCLRPASGGWTPDSAAPLSVFVMELSSQALTMISGGIQPQWRP